MLLLVSGMEGWACTIECKGRGTSASGEAASDIGFFNNNATCHNENGAAKNMSPHKGVSLTKRGIKRKSPSCGLGGVLCMSTPPLGAALINNYASLKNTKKCSTCIFLK